VPGALIALQNADRSLSRSDKPQFIAIRRAIARDIERLKALPGGFAGIAVRLDSAIGQIDNLPLLVDERPVAAASAAARECQPAAKAWPGKMPRARRSSPVEARPGAMAGRRRETGKAGAARCGPSAPADPRAQVRTPEALMLSPTQAYFLRENLKLRLLNARMALLSRNEFAFRNDLASAQDTIAKYFDTRAKQVQTTQALLKQVQGSNLSIQLPTLAEPQCGAQLQGPSLSR
jgi:uroporphyrin-3 C-methyltransferase/uroporphyrinogen III methyltransferase/synthase